VNLHRAALAFPAVCDGVLAKTLLLHRRGQAEVQPGGIALKKR
jgi:hypothetical protein